ncbi:MAG: hypothetical protein LBO05_10165 [Deltaproteobacteria bacterium]|nr:hypothetical protein [Deltaproteobacteria bacterium]
METWKHGNMETWKHGNMETWKHGNLKTWKPEKTATKFKPEQARPETCRAGQNSDQRPGRSGNNRAAPGLLTTRKRKNFETPAKEETFPRTNQRMKNSPGADPRKKNSPETDLRKTKSPAKTIAKSSPAGAG